MRYLIVCGWHFDYLCGWDQSPLCADINNIPGQMDRATLKHASLWRSTLKFSLVRRMKYCRDVINPRRIKVHAWGHETWYAELVGVICYMEKKSAGMLTELQEMKILQIQAVCNSLVFKSWGRCLQQNNNLEGTGKITYFHNGWENSFPQILFGVYLTGCHAFSPFEGRHNYLSL